MLKYCLLLLFVVGISAQSYGQQRFEQSDDGQYENSAAPSGNQGNYEDENQGNQVGEAGPEPPAVIPQTSFTCEGLPYQPGMYADMEVDCGVYHMCFDGRKESFLCGTGTVFNQEILSCDHPQNVDCAASPSFYSANEELGKPGAEPAPGGGSQRPVPPRPVAPGQRPLPPPSRPATPPEYGIAPAQRPAPSQRPAPAPRPRPPSKTRPAPNYPPQRPAPAQRPVPAPRPPPVQRPVPAPRPPPVQRPVPAPRPPSMRPSYRPQPPAAPRPPRPSKVQPPRPAPRPRPIPPPVVQTQDDTSLDYEPSSVYVQQQPGGAYVRSNARANNRWKIMTDGY